MSVLLLEILKILLRDEILAPDLDIKALAKQTDTFSGSDLKREYDMLHHKSVLFITSFADLCVSAALDAVKERVHVPWASNSTTPQTAELSGAVVESPTPVAESLTPVELPTTTLCRLTSQHLY